MTVTAILSFLCVMTFTPCSRSELGRKKEPAAANSSSEPGMQTLETGRTTSPKFLCGLDKIPQSWGGILLPLEPCVNLTVAHIQHPPDCYIPQSQNNNVLAEEPRLSRWDSTDTP